MKSDNNCLHLIGKSEEESHSEVGSEFPVAERSIRVLLINDFGAVQCMMIFGKGKLYKNSRGYFCITCYIHLIKLKQTISV